MGGTTPTNPSPGTGTGGSDNGSVPPVQEEPTPTKTYHSEGYETLLNAYDFLGIGNDAAVTSDVVYMRQPGSEQYVLANRADRIVYFELIYSVADARVDSVIRSDIRLITFAPERKIAGGAERVFYHYVGEFQPVRIVNGAPVYSCFGLDVRRGRGFLSNQSVHWDLQVNRDSSGDFRPIPTIPTVRSPWAGNLVKRDDDGVYLTPYKTPELQAPPALSEDTAYPKDVTVSPGALDSGSGDNSMFNWDVDRGATAIKAGGGLLPQGTKLTWQEATSLTRGSDAAGYIQVLNGSDTSLLTYFYTYGPGPSSNRFGHTTLGASVGVRTVSRYWVGDSGYFSGVASRTPAKRQKGSKFARWTSGTFKNQVQAQPGLTQDQVLDIASDHVDEITGWDQAPYHYNVGTGMLTFAISI